jgi:hypothetical protein
MRFDPPGKAENIAAICKKSLNNQNVVISRGRRPRGQGVRLQVPDRNGPGRWSALDPILQRSTGWAAGRSQDGNEQPRQPISIGR